MSISGFAVFIEEDPAMRAHITSLLPTGLTMCSLTWQTTEAELGHAPDVVLAENKDRCVNRALLFCQTLERACPIFVYDRAFTRFRRNDLQARGVAGMVPLDAPPLLLQVRLASIVPPPYLAEPMERERQPERERGSFRAFGAWRRARRWRDPAQHAQAG